MILKYLNDSVYDTLKDEIDENYNKYLLDEEWIDSLFPEHDYTLNTNIQFEKIDFCKDESVNAIKLYESLHDLTLNQAIDPRLWGYLTHVVYYDYMHRRWPIHKSDNPKSEISTIKERYFCSTSKRSLMRNGLSRLWWGVNMSIDVNNDDPYVYTKILFKSEDNFTGLLERDFSNSNDVLIGILMGMKFYIDCNEKLPHRDVLRILYKNINQRGAITLLESLKRQDICNYIIKQIKYIEDNIEKFLD